MVRPPPYSTTTFPLNRRQTPAAYSSTSQRCKLFVVLIALIMFGVFVREREAYIRKHKDLAVSTEDKGVRSVIASADKIIGKGYRYISDHVSKGVSASTQATWSKLSSGLRNTMSDREEEEENELFAQLLAEEKGEASNEKPRVEAESPEQVMQMMQEGVVEDPRVDHEDDQATSGDFEASAKLTEASIVVEGLHVPPSKEELKSGAAVVVNIAAGDEFIEEQSESEGEEVDDEETASASLVTAGTEEILEMDQPVSTGMNSAKHFISGPFVKGHLAFKMVNTHFLALTDAFRYTGWTKYSESASVSDVSLLLTKPVTPVIGSSSKMISQISHSSCLGGTKGTQLSCRSRFAAEHGCTFESLNISPKQYNMWKSADCERFFEFALLPENAEKQWIGKVGASYHGRHITIYKGVTKSIKSHYGKCKLNKESGGGYIMMEYVSDPALLGGRKFDLRTFLLIGSTNPFLVWYHKGFVRRSANKYSSDVSDKLAHVTNHEGQTSEDHFMGFDDLGKALMLEHNFPVDYLSKTFEPRVQKITNFIFQAARARLKRKLGAYQLFGLDWMIDKQGNMHLLEGNGNPVVKHYPGTNELTPNIWREMAGLLTKTHMAVAQNATEPFGPLVEGFSFGGWKLVFSELEELANNRPYDPCHAGL